MLQRSLWVRVSVRVWIRVSVKVKVRVKVKSAGLELGLRLREHRAKFEVRRLEVGLGLGTVGIQERAARTSQNKTTQDTTRHDTTRHDTDTTKKQKE